MRLLDQYVGHVSLARLVLQRGMALLYLIAFLTVKNQCKPLLGERGLLPIPAFLARANFHDAPSLFHWRYSDRLLDLVAWTGIIISACAALGLTEAGPVWLSLGAWLLLYFLYLSVVNVGQRFFGFGWESMLLEAGFFTAFLGPSHMQPSIIPVLILRWMLFRTELGAGLIKLRGDRVWKDLTALFYHYETQPLPNPLSWHFHRLPRWSHKFGVLFSHFVQVIVPFGLFGPQPVAAIAAALCTAQQVWLIVSGNYSWLNWLTALLGIAGVSDEVLGHAMPDRLLQSFRVCPTSAFSDVGSAAFCGPIPLPWHIVLYVLAAATLALSVQPVVNLCSRLQKMNYSYNRYHLVNSYGAFGTVGKERFEIVIEGTRDTVLSAATHWQEYGFKAKPGDPKRMPPQIAPYHLRLDWMIWFLPFSVQVTRRGIHVPGHDLWFIRFVHRLLRNDAPLLRLMGHNPFPEEPPTHIRALYYRYRYADAQTKRDTGAWWTRELLGTYLPPVTAEYLDQF